MQAHLAASFALAVAFAITPGTRPARAEQAVPVSVPEDRSLTVDQYVERGLPSLDAAWGQGEAVRAARLVAELASADPTLLPREGSERSGAVFERVLAESLTFGGLGSGAPSASLEAYAFDPERGLLFDRELVAIRRATAEANLRVVHESVAARAEVGDWMAAAERDGSASAVDRLRELRASQDRISGSYGSRLLAAIEGLVDLCEMEAASDAARALARADAERLLTEAEPVMTPAAADSGAALRARLRSPSGCGAVAEGGS